MTRPDSRRRMAYRQRLADERVLIDGRPTCLCEGVIHGKASTYSNHSCRCEVCTKAHAAFVANSRERRLRSRVMVAGTWINLAAPKHGKHSTYSNWGCHCTPCVEAWRGYVAWLNAREKK